MKNKIVFISVLIVASSFFDVLSAQGIYIKPGLSYGIGLSKENIWYNSSATTGEVATYHEKIDFSHNNVLENSKDKQEELIPLGKGKIFNLEIGYENKKCLYYSIGFSSGLSDKYETNSFYDRHDLGIAYETQSHEVRKQIVSSVWYGAQFGIGIYKNVNKYKFVAGISGFLGTCRIQIMDISTTSVINRNLAEEPQKKIIYEASNHILHGSYMSGYGILFGIERSVNEISAIGLMVGYRCQYYSPTTISYKELNNRFNFLGSVIPVSNSSYRDAESLETVPPYVFESLSLVATWKRYLFQ